VCLEPTVKAGAKPQGNVPFEKTLSLRLVLTSQMSRMYRVYVGIKNQNFKYQNA
jgi:hypothetical protein